MKNVQKHLGLLGLKVKDKITGATGVVDTVAFDLYGCIQVIINRGLGLVKMDKSLNRNGMMYQGLKYFLMNQLWKYQDMILVKLLKVKLVLLINH